jgi:hypothetical protein
VKFKVGDVVYYRERETHPSSFIIKEGPFRTFDSPDEDQYVIKNYMGSIKGAAGYQLMSEAEYRASLKGEE